LITGATGFLGSSIAKKIFGKHKLILTKRSDSDISRIYEIIKKTRIYDIEIVPIKKIFEENNIELIIHCATDFGRNHSSLTRVLETNVLFPLQILEVGIEFKVKTFINSDTILIKNVNEYSLSKHQFLDWMINLQHKIQIINMKLEHLYGPLDDDSKFVTRMISKMLNSEKEIFLTSGDQKRDFIYINDAVNAYETVINSISSTPQNILQYEIGSGVGISIKNFMTLIHRLTASNSKLCFGAIPYRKHEIMNSVADLSNLTKLGWSVENSIEDGLLKTINYMRDLK
jgi:nucleoside-diphosphate-sugar epimerase